MSNVAENLKEKAETLENLANGTNIAIQEMRIQFETLAEMQKEERLATQEMHNKEKEQMREHHDKEVRHWKHICIGLIATIILIIGSLVGGTIYVINEFDFTILDDPSFSQYLDIGGNGNPTINDGIHYNYAN